MRCWLLVGVLLLGGCGRGLYSGQGELASAGGRLGTWSVAPMGCSRDPFVGGDEGKREGGLLTFVWEDPGRGLWLQHKKLGDRWTSNWPMRLEIAREGSGYAATLKTLHVQDGTRIESAACSEFRVEQREKPAHEAHGRPVVDGVFAMDCAVEGGRITAQIRFEDCGY